MKIHNCFWSVAAALVIHGPSWLQAGDDALKDSPALRPSADTANLAIVYNGQSRPRDGVPTVRVLEACRKLVRGNAGRFLDAGSAYLQASNGLLAIDAYPSPAAVSQARWLRGWLAGRIKPGDTLVLLGDEKTLPAWEVSIGRLRLTTDAFYTDLDGDGVPETAVARIVGTPEHMLRQLQGKPDYGSRAIVLCSEDTRIHLETRGFSQAFAQRGYDVTIRGTRDDAALAASDFIVHFGHGDPARISNRFGETFVDASALPDLPRAPIVFVDGCGTLPVGSPLLAAFLAHGAVAYCGSTATVQGMIPARFTNELVEHLLRLLAAQGGLTLPQALMQARATYVRGHRGLSDSLRELAARGELRVEGDSATDLLTVTEWVYYGDPRAALPRVGKPLSLSRSALTLPHPIRLMGTEAWWATNVSVKPQEGQAVLAVYVAVPVDERDRFRLEVCQDNRVITVLDSHQDTVYQNLGQYCRGGYVGGDFYQARYLVPLPRADGVSTIAVHLAQGTVVELLPGTQIDVWPADFEKVIGLRQEPVGSRASRRESRRKPIRVTGKAQVQPTAVAGFYSLDLSALCNRPHTSTQVGGGDDASFKTWFVADEVTCDGVPFRVRRAGNDVLVSPNNTENVFEITGPGRKARMLHLLVWGYMNPDRARLSLEFADGSVQDCDVPLSEWTKAVVPVAFDFENTVPSFRHAAVAHQVLRIASPTKQLVQIRSHSGTYGVIAITLEE